MGLQILISPEHFGIYPLNSDVGKRHAEIEILFYNIWKIVCNILSLHQTFRIMIANNHEDIRKKLGKVVCEMRKTRSVSQQQLCDYTGLSQKYLSDLENGKRNIGLDTIVMLSNYFNISLGDFFLEVEHMEM